MKSHVYELDAREGGAIRVSLTYSDTAEAGKSAPHTDTYSGRFVRLVEGEQVVEAFEFETREPGLRGEMTMTTTITPTAAGCLVEMLHERVPDAVPPADNELGMQMALDRLASLVEGEPGDYSLSV